MTNLLYSEKTHDHTGKSTPQRVLVCEQVEASMVSTVTVMKSGNSAVIALPAEWRKARGIEVGNKLEVSFSGNGALMVDTQTQNASSKFDALANMIARTNAMPHIPWEDDSREADRALIAGRYI